MALLLAGLAVAPCRAELSWGTDYNAALKQAHAEGKTVLLDFTGSDWCGWCMKLKAEVFDTAEFAEFANANLILVEVDFPHGKALSAAQNAANQKLASRFEVQGFPTVVLVNGSGHAVLESGYVAGGPSAFLNELKKARGVSWKAGTASGPNTASAHPAPTAPTSPAVTHAAVPSAPVQPWAGQPVQPPKHYEDLKLTGLSGSASRRFAMVNNQTFAPGETARVKFKDGEVRVLCKEIRARSVIVQLDGSVETKEIFLDGI